MFSSNTAQVGSSGPANYIEDVFSTYLYTGASAGNDTTFINNIDLTTKGGMVWLKQRDSTGPNPTSSGYAPGNHYIFDTARGNQNALCPSAAVGQDTSFGSGYFNFLTNGFNTGNGGNGYTNITGNIFASWTFRKQAKFFDVVTYTGNGVNNRAIAHALGTEPGCVIVKATSNAQNWPVYHRSTGANTIFWLNATNANTANTGYFPTAPNSTSFYVGTDTDVNQSGYAYVAYIFAHNAGGFGLNNTDNVITCGTYTGNASLSGPVVTLGYEPQWVLIKRTDSTGNWLLQDNMRSLSHTNTDMLFPNLSNLATTGAYPSVVPTDTGFYIGDNGTNYNASGGTYIYIAIRRGPMKVPTVGTSVFSTIVANNAQGTQNTTGFPVDMQLAKYTAALGTYAADRLRGVSTTATTGGQHLITSSTAAEVSTNATQGWNNTGFQTSSGWAGTPMVYWNFRRAPSFFDVVCYTGNGNSESALNHSLGIPPELVIVKARSRVTDGDSTWSGWWVKVKGAGNTARVFGAAHPYPVGGSGLHSNGSGGAASYILGGSRFNNTTFTPYYVTEAGGDIGLAGNMTGEKYVAYLFATCPGVSKVGTYTGTGSPQTINCGFTTGARFIMLKCTSLNGTNWVLFDSVRGIVSGIDPFLYLNSTIGQQSTLDLVAPQSTGFGFGSESYYGEINQSGQNYMFLAIA